MRKRSLSVMILSGATALVLAACGGDDSGGAGGGPEQGSEGGAGGAGGGTGGGGSGSGGTGGGGPSCDGDWTLGGTFYTCPDCGLGQQCDNRSMPKNCADGSWITFADGGCRCIAKCSSLHVQVGGACDKAGSWHCREIKATNANANGGKFCVLDAWNICDASGSGSGGSGSGGSGSGGSGSGGSGSGGSGSGSCKGQGESCSEDEECCDGSCSFDECQ